MPSVEPRPRRAAEPLFRGTGSDPRLELVVQESDRFEELEDPFVTLGDAGRIARVLLGRIAVGESTTVRYVGVKMQRDVVLATTTGIGNTTLGNREIESMWEREILGLSGVGSDHVAKLVGEARICSPTTFCKRTRQYFHPPSPQTGERLEVCKDDHLLRECGLQPYGAGTTRYLFSPPAVGRRRETGLPYYTVGPAGD
jgi:hypothetical protein